MKKVPEFKDVTEFESLSDSDKEAIFSSMDKGADLSKWRAMTPQERRRFESFRKGALSHRRGRGRPKLGKGAKIVGISIESDLLAKAEALAKRKKVGRSELFVAGVRILLENPELVGAA